MTTMPEAHIRVRVDLTNPGQFFACCGLLELADRTWGGAQGWFENHQFNIRASEAGTLIELLRGFKDCRPVNEVAESTAESNEGSSDEEEEDDDDNVEPLYLPLAVPLRLDWWGDKSLKPWAGSMKARLIYGAMTQAIDEASPDPLNDSRLVFDPTPQLASGKRATKPKKREPFYFDARRGASARSLDIGFAPDSIKKLHAVSYPAVESLCFVGLQRCRPMPASIGPRVSDYYAWTVPLDPWVAAAAVCGLVLAGESRGFRFENAFRTDQRKHKAFSSATPHQEQL